MFLTHYDRWRMVAELSEEEQVALAPRLRQWPSTYASIAVAPELQRQLGALRGAVGYLEALLQNESEVVSLIQQVAWAEHHEATGWPDSKSYRKSILQDAARAKRRLDQMGVNYREALERAWTHAAEREAET